MERANFEAKHAAVREGNSLFGVTLVGGVFVVCLIRLMGFVKANAVDLISEDQWDFLTPLFDGKGPWAGFFYQHGPHRQGLGGLIDWFLYRATDWDVRAEAWAAVVVLSLATIAAITLAARLRGRLSWSDAAFPLLLLAPIHWEPMTFTPYMAPQILPLLLTFLLALAWGSAGPTTRVLGVGIFGTLTLFTGYGFCGAPVTIGLALFLWLRPGKEEPQVDRRQAALILSILGVAAAVFARGYHWAPGMAGWRFPVPNWWDYPRFCALMFSNLFESHAADSAVLLNGHVAGTGAFIDRHAGSAAMAAVGLVLLGLVVWVFVAAAARLWQRKATSRARAIWVLTGTSLAYAVLTAVGRLPSGIDAVFMWRYVTLMTPAICGLALAAEDWPIARPGWLSRGLVLGWVILAASVWSNFSPERNAAAIAMGKNRWVATYLETRDLSTTNKNSGFLVYLPDPASPRIAERLHWLEQRHWSFFRERRPDQER